MERLFFNEIQLIDEGFFDSTKPKVQDYQSTTISIVTIPVINAGRLYNLPDA